MSSWVKNNMPNRRVFKTLSTPIMPVNATNKHIDTGNTVHKHKIYIPHYFSYEIAI